MRRKRSSRLLAAIIFVLLGAVTTWLIDHNRASSPQSLDGYPLAQPKSETATVTTRTITSVIAMNATVVAAPTFRPQAPVGGVFKHNKAAKGRVAAGTVLGWIQTGTASTPVTTPVDATLRDTLVDDSAVVPAGMPLLSLQTSGFGLRATAAVMGILAGALAGALAGITPAWRAAQLPIATVMRA